MAYVMRQKVLFKHCDPAGLVFYPRYFEMINDAVEGLFDQRLDAPFEVLHKTGSVPTARIDTNFTAPSRHGDWLDICVLVQRIGNTSLDLTVTATSGDQTRFVANSTLVYINLQGRPQRWPDAIRAKLSNEIGENECPTK